jgi:hypothetical protein
MRKRGRKSADELATITPITDWRPPCPEDLTDAEAALWNLTVRRMPSDWFPAETWPILKAMCRHAVLADDLSRAMERNRRSWGEDHFERLNRVAAMRERETRAMLACARSLRLTKQAQIDPKTAARQAADPLPEKPWEYRLGEADG